MKITCNVVRDLADLYVGDILSDDSKMIVEEHISSCADCKAYIEKNKSAFEKKIEPDFKKIAEEKANIESLKGKVLGKVIPVVMMTIIVMTIVFAAVDYLLFEYEIVIPYDDKTIYVTEDGILHYPDCYGVTFVGSGSSEYMRVYVRTHYIDKLRGVEPEGEYMVDLKEMLTGDSKTQLIYKDGVNEQVIWEKK